MPSSLSRSTLQLLLALTLLDRIMAAVAAPASRWPLVLLSLDGLRHDYLTLFASSTPNLNRLAAGDGAYAVKVKPAYVTKTAANHWTIATGLYQEVHGVVNNQVFDPEFNETVEMLDTADERWWNASEPVWLTAESYGLRTGVCQWPGGNAAIGGRLPTYLTPRTAPFGSTGLAERLDTALDWVTNGGASLVVVYYHEPDLKAHYEGVEALGPVLAEIDTAIGRFFGQLEARSLRDRLNVIITSDHGMLPVNQTNVVRVNARGHPDTRAVVQMDIALGLFARPGRAGKLQAAMRREIGDRPVRALLRDELPDQLHYKRHRRIPDLLLMPSHGYLVADTTDRVWKRGIHGGESDWDEMQVPLLAAGPSFRRGARVDAAQQVDIYGLVCRLLGVPARPHNGTERPLADLLTKAAVPATSVRTPAAVLALPAILVAATQC